MYYLLKYLSKDSKHVLSANCGLAFAVLVPVLGTQEALNESSVLNGCAVHSWLDHSDVPKTLALPSGRMRSILRKRCTDIFIIT